MIPDEHLGLIEAARAIAAGRSVDWQTVESSSGDNESVSKLLRQLKVIEEIAVLHRTMSGGSAALDSGVGSDAEAGKRTTAGQLATWGPLTLLERIGLGAFGAVYRAWDPRLEREVALKLLRQVPSMRDSLGTMVIDEGRLLARVRHPNVVTVYGADRIEGQVGLWMELVRGRTLEEVLREHGRLGPQEAALIGLDVCRALSAVHRAGLIHRDIKAQNVVREAGGRIVLMDFGAGRDAAPDEASVELAGTPLYLAPEIFAGTPASARSDVYSVGVLLYHLVTASYPVRGRTVADLRDAHLHGRRSWLRDERPDLPGPFVLAVERALARDPAERYDSAGEMEAALARVLSQEAESIGAVGPSRDRPVPSASLGRAWMVAGALGAAVLGGAVVARSVQHRANSGGPAAQRAAAALGDASSVSLHRIPIDPFSYIGTPSADGQWFSYADDNGNLTVWEVATGRKHQVTSDASWSTHGSQFAGASAISHDSTLIAYAWSALDGQYELRVTDLHGLHPRVVLRDPAIDHAVPLQWSHDGRSLLTLVFRAAGTSELAFVDISDGSVRVLKRLGRNWPNFASVSPDDRFVVFDAPSAPDATTRDVVIVQSDGSNEHPLMRHPANDAQPVWTPDGRGVLFVSDRSGSNDVWRVDVDRGFAISEPQLVHRNVGRMWLRGLTDTGVYFFYLTAGTVDVYESPITNGGAAAATPVSSRYVGSNISSLWAPERTQIAYASRRGFTWFDRGSTTLVIHDAASGLQRELQPALDGFLLRAWSPDGRHLLVGGTGLDKRQGNFSIDVTTGEVAPIELGARPDWLRDGRVTFVDRATQRIIARTTSGAEEVLFDGRAEGLTPVADILGRGYRVSPTGEQLAFTALRDDGEANGRTISVRDLHGGSTRELVRSSPPELLMFQDWTPDGNSLLFTRWNANGGETSLWRVSIHGGAPQPLGSMVGMRDVSVDREGARITFTGGFPVNELWTIANIFSVK